MTTDKFKQYAATYAGRELLKKHSLSETGLWQIKGEDPNCDLGGHHYQPDLGIVEGTLQDVINYAVSLKSFWQWGAGGDIKKLGPIPKIDATSTAKRVALEQELKETEARAKQLRKELGGL